MKILAITKKMCMLMRKQNKEAEEKEQEKEDIRVSNEYRLKVLVCEAFQSFLTILHVGNSMVIYEISYADDGSMDEDVTIQLYISTFSCLSLIFMLIGRYILMLKWLKSKKYVHNAETLWSTGMYKTMIMELIITTIGPQIFFKGATYSEYVYTYDITIVYPINSILCSFVWIKLYVIIRSFLLSNKWTTPRAQRVCLLNGCYADTTFSFRANFKEKANTILIAAYMLTSFILAYMLRIFERPLSEVSGQNFNYFWTAIWNVFITMTTVGYGDTFPKSYGGRILGTFVCVWGVLLVSLFVVTVTEALEFESSEKNSYMLIQRLKYREDLRESAAKVIACMYKLKLLTRHLKNILTGNEYLDKSSDLNKMKNTDFEFRRALLEFRQKSLEMRQFEDNNHELIFLSKNVDNIAEELENITEKQRKLKEKQTKIVSLINLLTGSNIDPDQKYIPPPKEPAPSKNISKLNTKAESRANNSRLLNQNTSAFLQKKTVPLTKLDSKHIVNLEDDMSPYSNS